MLDTLYRTDSGGSSVSILDDSSYILCVQTGSGVHPASCTMGTVGPLPGVKRGWSVMLTTQPHLVARVRMSRSYTSSPRCRLHGGSGTALIF
jgi:hypothetical protein